MRKIFIFASLIVLALSSAAFAQTVQEAKDQAEIEKAKADAASSRAAAKKSELDLQQAEEKAKIDLQAAKDKADDAKRKALTESIGLVNELKMDAKDVSVKGNAIETKALANRAVARAAQQVVTMIPAEVCGKATTVILADDLAIGTLPNYEAGLQALRVLAKSFTGFVANSQKGFAALKDTHDRKEKAVLAALPALLQGVAAVGSIAQTFRTQLTVDGTDVTIDQLAVYGALAGTWTATCSTSTLTAYPNLGVDFAKSEAAKLLDEISDQLGTAQELEIDIALWLIPKKAASATELAAIEAAQKAAAKPAAKPAAAAAAAAAAAKPAPEAPKPKAPTAAQKAAADARKSAIAEIESILAKLKAADQRVDAAIQQLFATSEKQPVSPIAQLAKAERFATALKATGAYVLTIKAVAGGGNTVTTNNFWRGPKVFHSGGAVLAYTLLRGSDGRYVGGSLLDSHQGYFELKVAEKNSLGNSWDPVNKPSAVPVSNWTTKGD